MFIEWVIYAKHWMLSTFCALCHLILKILSLRFCKWAKCLSERFRHSSKVTKLPVSDGDKIQSQVIWFEIPRSTVITSGGFFKRLKCQLSPSQPFVYNTSGPLEKKNQPKEGRAREASFIKVPRGKRVDGSGCLKEKTDNTFQGENPQPFREWAGRGLSCPSAPAVMRSGREGCLHNELKEILKHLKNSAQSKQHWCTRSRSLALPSKRTENARWARSCLFYSAKRLRLMLRDPK